MISGIVIIIARNRWKCIVFFLCINSLVINIICRCKVNLLCSKIFMQYFVIKKGLPKQSFILGCT